MKIIETLKNLKKAYILGYRIAKKNAECGNVHFPAEVVLNVPVYHMNEMVEASGASICVVTKKDNNIWVDDSFLSLSQNTKEFIVLHEEGHKMSGHLEQDAKELREIMKQRTLNPSLVPLMEQEADAYAVRAIGVERCVEALEEMIDVQMVKGYSVLELLNRIDIIEGRNVN